MTTKILILGSCGMLGQELIHLFNTDKKYQTIGWDQKEVDITNKQKLEEKIVSLAPKIIINAAAYNAVDRAEENDDEYQKAKLINGIAVGYLAQICRLLQITFVHYSTDYVFDGKKGEYQESDQPNPLSRYGRSKLLGEKNLLRAAQQNLKELEKNFDFKLINNGDEFRFYLIRLSKLFGKAAASKQAKHSFFDIMLALGKKNNEVKAVNSEKSCFTYAPDLARGTKKLIENKMPNGIYHLTNSGVCTWYEAALTLYKITGLKVKVIPVSSAEFPRPAPRARSSVLINTKLPPLRDYQDALTEYLKKERASD